MVIYQDDNQTHIDNYLSSINRTVIDEKYIGGRIYWSNDADDYDPLYSADFKIDGFKYDNEICDGQKFLLGSTYSGRIEVGLYKNYNLRNLINKLISIGIFVKDTTRPATSRPNWFLINFGIYIITEASQEEGYIKITAYDKLINGNENNVSSFSAGFSNWRPSTIISYYGGLNNVDNSALPDLEVHNPAYINNLMPLDETGENPIYFKSNALNYLSQRELLSDISQILGCYCTCYRELDFSWYQTKPTYIEHTQSTPYLRIHKIGEDGTAHLVADKIKSLKVSTNTIHFDGVIMHVLDSVYTAGDVLSGGRIYEFTTKLMDNNTAWERQAMVDALWTNTLSQINYTPVELEYFGDPALEVGDVITIPYNGGIITSFISSLEYSLDGIQKIKCCEFNTVITGNTSNSTQKEQNRIKSMLSGKNKVIRITDSDLVNTELGGTTDIYISDPFNISEQNNFILQGIIKINLESNAPNVLYMHYYTKKGNSNWRIDYPLGDITISLTNGDNYINIFHCFDISELHETNQIKIVMIGNSRMTITEANLSLTGSIL